MANVKLSDTTLLYGEPTDINGLGGIDMNTQVLPNMGAPVNPNDSANKDYVDTAIAAIPVYNFVEKLNTASALVSQEPSALDTEQLVMFGPEVLVGDVQLQTSGSSESILMVHVKGSVGTLGRTSTVRPNRSPSAS